MDDYKMALKKYRIQSDSFGLFLYVLLV